MTPNRAQQARAMYDAGPRTVQQIADTFGIFRLIIYRHLAETATPPPPAGVLQAQRGTKRPPS